MRKKTDYFNILSELSGLSLGAGRLLRGAVESFKPSGLALALAELEKITDESESKTRALRGGLIREFLPPLDRGDILLLAGAADDVTRSFGGVLAGLFVYGIGAVRGDVPELARCAARCCEALANAFSQLSGFKKPDGIFRLTDCALRLSKEGCEACQNAVKLLFCSPEPTARVLAWHEIYGGLSRCCRLCGRAADSVEDVIIKNL